METEGDGEPRQGCSEKLSRNANPMPLSLTTITEAGLFSEWGHFLGEKLVL